MNYGEATCVKESAMPAPKSATIAEVTEQLSGNVTRLAQVLNALCANMAGAETEKNIGELPSAPLLPKLAMIEDCTRYCLERADTLLRVMGQ